MACVKFIIWVVVNALALAAAAWLLAGITVTGQHQVLHMGLVALVFGVINAVVRPVVKLLSLPFIIVTLGLLILVINALMLMLTSAVSGSLHLGFHVDGFLTALLGAIIVSIASAVLHLLVPDGD